MNVLDEILVWVKANHENSTLVTRAQASRLFPWPKDIQTWCQKHQLKATPVERGWNITKLIEP